MKNKSKGVQAAALRKLALGRLVARKIRKLRHKTRWKYYKSKNSDRIYWWSVFIDAKRKPYDMR